MGKPKKETRIKNEKARLEKLYDEMEPSKKSLAAGLIERAAFMRVECEDLEADLQANGWTEQFQQAKGMDPYDRARPQGQAYQSLNSNYQKIIKQLDAMLPGNSGGTGSDGFDAFIAGRDN